MERLANEYDTQHKCFVIVYLQFSFIQHSEKLVCPKYSFKVPSPLRGFGIANDNRCVIKWLLAFDFEVQATRAKTEMRQFL